MSEHLEAVHPEPNMVQLLTPEGQRVEHPNYPLDISDDDIAALNIPTGMPLSTSWTTTSARSRRVVAI